MLLLSGIQKRNKSECYIELDSTSIDQFGDSKYILTGMHDDYRLDNQLVYFVHLNEDDRVKLAGLSIRLFVTSETKLENCINFTQE